MRIDIGGRSAGLSGLSAQLGQAGQPGNALAEAQCVSREPEIPAQLDRVVSASEYLSERLAMLEQKLSPVLRSRPPQETDNQAKYPVQGTLFGGRLADLGARIALMTQALESIDDRLEI